MLTHGLTPHLALNFQGHRCKEGSLTGALFFGFSAAMLGISGFESSANFVEEQAPGVFQKTLRNMWVVVTVFNPLLAFVAIAVLPLATVGPHAETLLSYLGTVAGGPWLGQLIAVDAVAVLSGAVLTSFVGVSGLMKRMALDRILPAFFSAGEWAAEQLRDSAGFFLLCVSVLLVTAGQLGPLAGVYTISFLSVMAFFAYGNFLLKSKQPHLPRPVRASIFTVGLALAGVLAALFGNIKLHPEDLVVFLEYFLPAMFLVYAMLNRTDVLELLRLAVEGLTKPLPRAARVFRLLLWRQQRELARQEYIFFTKDDDLINLNKVMAYVVENEFTSRLRIVTLLHYDEDYPAELLERHPGAGPRLRAAIGGRGGDDRPARPGTGEHTFQAMGHPEELYVHRLHRRLGPLPHFGAGRGAAHYHVTHPVSLARGFAAVPGASGPHSLSGDL